ncbi:MAG: Oligopeptide transport system permease protein OppC [Pseudomonadota bacterium]|jgi:peptide/nickel transport system permease protein
MIMQSHPNSADNAPNSLGNSLSKGPDNAVSEGAWALAWRRFKSDRVGVWSGITVILSLALVFTTLVGPLASDWEKEVAVNNAPPTWAKSAIQGDDASKAIPEVVLYEPTSTDVVDPIAVQWEQAQKAVKPAGDKVNALATHLPMGSDKWGRDVLAKTIKGAETSILVGLAAAFMATLLGSVLGAVSGWYGGIVDDLSNWLYNVFHSIPGILLILAIAAVLNTKGTMAVVLILGITGWTGTYRLMRGEYLKHRNREYVRAADAIGASNNRRMFVHILPNVSHVILVQFSLLTVSCIKAEVILSFLGFGVPVDGVSWGTMLTEAQNDLLVGYWWQLLSATTAMSIFVTGLSLLTDSLRDALDPKVIH